MEHRNSNPEKRTYQVTQLLGVGSGLSY